jgi:hypothetical protein
MGYVVIFNRLAFQRTQDDEPSMPDGPEDVLSRGDPVPDYVSQFTLDALAASGMIAMVGELPAPIEPEPVGPEPPAGPVMPASVATRGAWEKYAEDRGMSAEQAQSYANKAELIDAVTALAE